MKLRPYQEDLVKNIRNEINSGKSSVCAVLGCGGGKSVIEGTIARLATEKGNRVLFLVHRQELCQQIQQTFELCGVDPVLCTVAMVQTVSRRLADMPIPALIITDECHHATSNTYKRIYERFSGAVRIGFTATPVRMVEGGLGAVFDSLIESVSTKWLIANGYLAPYKYYSVKVADIKGLPSRGGDYDKAALAELMEQKYIYGKTVETYERICKGRQTIVYCASIEASKRTAEEFSRAGYSAAHIDGMTPPAERARLIQGYRDGRVMVLTNVELFGEGFDVPDCECVVLLRPTKSLSLFIQQSMRSMRYKPNKVAYIIDHVANVYRHGFPDDVREWSLEMKRRKQRNTVSVKECSVCFAVLPLFTKVCPYCGAVLKQTQEERRVEVEAELAEIKSLPYEDYRKVKSFDELAMFGKARKYKFMWTVRKAVELGLAIPQKYRHLERRLVR